MVSEPLRASEHNAQTGGGFDVADNIDVADGALKF